MAARQAYEAHRDNVIAMRALINGTAPEDAAERERLLWLLCGLHAGALTPVSADEVRGVQRVLAILDRRLGEGGGIVGGDPQVIDRHNQFYRARWTAFCECAMMLRAAIKPMIERLPAREEAAWAASILLRCNGHDLTVWGGEDLLDAKDALRTLAESQP